ncbi:hypothetical protein HN011_005374 [Eciton burchellii]|nr:hypothetical protein HN011_005374 [Eciton burchellii]
MPLLPLDHFRFPDAVTLHLCRFSAASPVPAIERTRVSSLGKHPRKPRGLNSSRVSERRSDEYPRRIIYLTDDDSLTFRSLERLTERSEALASGDFTRTFALLQIWNLKNRVSRLNNKRIFTNEQTYLKKKKDCNSAGNQIRSTLRRISKLGGIPIDRTVSIVQMLSDIARISATTTAPSLLYSSTLRRRQDHEGGAEVIAASMLCGELLSGGFVSAGAVPVVPCGVPGLWLPGCLRATSPRLLTSPYLTLLAELLAAGRLELRDDFLELMDLAKRGHQAPGGGNGAPELDLDLHADDIDENVFLGESRPFLPSKMPADAQRRRDVYFGVQRLMAKRPLERPRYSVDPTIGPMSKW